MSSITWPTPDAGVRTETGRLRAVMLHRPGRELRRLTPRNNAELLFDGLPWVERAQEEHDQFADKLRDRGVQVVLLGELLKETLDIPEARERILGEMVADLQLGERLESYLRGMLRDQSSEQLAEQLMAGIRNDEVAGPRTVVTSMKAPDTFLLPPLPNLYFTRDSSAWVNARPVVTSLYWPARGRENHLTELIYALHPIFAGHRPQYTWHADAHVEGGDIMAMAPGVLAIGVGERTTPAGVERLAQHVFTQGDIHTVLAVPLDKERAMMHLDTVCTMVAPTTFCAYPNIASSMTALKISKADDGELHIDTPKPFFELAAEQLGVDKVTVIDTRLDATEAEREQWDDGFNTLAVAPGVVVAYERNHGANQRLEDEGIEVIRIVGSELGTGRGGPRCMSCPIIRDDIV
ncbi:MAG: arginine deiminase [Propionibacteriaceae bacterium]